MKVKIEIEENCQECQVIIINHAMDSEVEEIVRKLKETFPQVLTGIINDTLEIINPETIIRVYAQNGKVYVSSTKGEYLLRLRLYEVGERLDSQLFVRISHSEIVNLKMIENFDLSFAGTIGVSLSHGVKTYVSRRYVKSIKNILGI